MATQELYAALTQALLNEATLIATVDTKLTAILAAVSGGQLTEAQLQAVLDKANANAVAMQALVSKLPDVAP